MPRGPKGRTVRATVRIPRRIYDDARRFVEDAAVPARNFNDFLVAAVSAYVKLLKRKQIDAAFSAMARDTDYQQEAHVLSEQFDASDWEAFALAERTQMDA